MSEDQATYKGIPIHLSYEPGYVYLIKPVGHNVYKIGYTNNLDRRKYQHEHRIKKKVEYVHYFKVNNMQYAESQVKNLFSSSHLSGEWYILTESEVEHFKSLEGVI